MQQMNEKLLAAKLEKRLDQGFPWVAYLNKGTAPLQYFTDAIDALQFCISWSRDIDTNRRDAVFYVYKPIENILSAIRDTGESKMTPVIDRATIRESLMYQSVGSIYPQGIHDLEEELSTGRIAALEYSAYRRIADHIDTYHVLLSEHRLQEQPPRYFTTILSSDKEYSTAYDKLIEHLNLLDFNSKESGFELKLTGKFKNMPLVISDAGDAHLFSGIRFDLAYLKAGQKAVERIVDPFKQTNVPQYNYARFNRDSGKLEFLDSRLSVVSVENSMHGVPICLFDGSDTTLIHNLTRAKMQGRKMDGEIHKHKGRSR